MKEILIKNVTILTMDDENSRFFGWILLKNGKIDALGEGEPPACSEVLDGEGGVLTPGLIDIHSHLGLYEDGLGFEGADGNEDTDPVTPQMRAIDAVNPMDHAFREALEALDPEAVLLLDNNAADAMRETYADMLVAIDDFDTAMLKPGLIAHVQGRRVLALDGFEAALTDKAAKQRMWAYIKQLTPAAAPL